MASHALHAPVAPRVAALPFLLPPLLIGSLLHRGLVDSGTPLSAVSVGERRPVLGQLQSDRRDVPLARAAILLDQKFRQLARAGVLRGFPDSFTVELRIDASGAVASVAFDRPCGESGKLLETQLLGWRFETWTGTGTTVLTVPVQMAQ